MNYQNYAKIAVTTPDGEAGIISVGICAVKHQGDYNRHLWEGQEFLKEKYGDTPADLFSDRNNEAVALRNRAGMLASFRKFEVLNGDGNYHEAELPAEWVTLETFSDALPLDVYENWLEAAIRLNPGLFGAVLTDDQKKGLSVTTTYSRNL